MHDETSVTRCVFPVDLDLPSMDTIVTVSTDRQHVPFMVLPAFLAGEDAVRVEDVVVINWTKEALLVGELLDLLSGVSFLRHGVYQQGSAKP